MDLHGCPQCAAVDVSWAEALTEKDGVLARRYHGSCDGCGLAREFLFALPELPTPPRPGAGVTFGADGDTSVLFDAGEWVEVADMMELAAGLPDVSEDESRRWRATATACIEEALKFMPPGGEAVPATAFWSAKGRGFRERFPGRFRRADLEARRAALAAGR